MSEMNPVWDSFKNSVASLCSISIKAREACRRAACLLLLVLQLPHGAAHHCPCGSADYAAHQAVPKADTAAALSLPAGLNSIVECS